MQHLDEGTIHAWLDGALDAEERLRVEAHVAACAECAGAVAEARGFIAAASRILTALDGVPAGVLPGSGGAPSQVDAAPPAALPGAPLGAPPAAPPAPPSVGAPHGPTDVRDIRDIRDRRGGRPARRLFPMPLRAAAVIAFLAAGGAAIVRSARTPEEERPALVRNAAREASQPVSVAPAPGRAGTATAPAAPRGGQGVPSPTPAPAVPPVAVQGRSAESARGGTETSAASAPAPAVGATMKAPKPRASATPGSEPARAADSVALGDIATGGAAVRRDSALSTVDQAQSFASVDTAPSAADAALAAPPPAASASAAPARAAPPLTTRADLANRAAGPGQAAERDGREEQRARVKRRSAERVAAPAAAADERRTELSGTVVDAGTGRPVPDARVSLEGLPLNTVTDADGRFALRGAPPGAHTVVVRRIGYATAERMVRIAPESRAVTLELQAAPAALEAQVVPAPSAPVPGGVAGLAGCYALTFTAWTPALALGADSVFVTVPRRIVLDTAPAPPGSGAAPGSFRITPVRGSVASPHRATTWRAIPRPSPTAADSAILVWSTGLSGVEARLGRRGAELRGVASTFWDFDRPRQRSQVRATRVRCDGG